MYPYFFLFLTQYPWPFPFVGCLFNRQKNMKRKRPNLLAATWASSLLNRPSQPPAAQLARKRQELRPPVRQAIQRSHVGTPDDLTAVRRP